MKLSLYFKLLILHILLGIGVYAVKSLALVYFLAIIIFFGYKFLMASKNYKTFYVLLACAYLVGAEVFLRMNGGTVFYEAIKYLVIGFIALGLFSNGFANQSFIYVLYLFLLIPGIFVAVSQLGFDTDIRRAIAFNLSGPLCLGIVAVFCYKRTVTFQQLKMILLALMLPLLSMTVYLFLYTPNLQEVITSTSSNFEASGGFGPNQVATVLGIGVFVMAARYFMSKETVFLKGLDLLLLGLFGFRALVTFSRGGVVTAIIMILFFLGVYYFKVNLKKKFQIKASLIVFLGIIILTWLVSTIQTSGFIEKRYANQDAAGREKEDITTGRTDLVAFELSEFVNNPFLGIGVGKIKEQRLNETGVQAASHNEMSRMVAEHGLLGIFAFLILFVTPLAFRLGNTSSVFFYSFYLFWFLTINHSAMRIAAPAFLYGLCLLNITYENKKDNRLKTLDVR
jgi:hypothetical protein